jgi:hypothetical protein
MERKDRLLEDYTHDPYFSKTKLHDPSVCEKCRVVFHHGIFDWITPPKDSPRMVCPACRRIMDGFEGGIVTLEGQFFEDHKQEIMNIVKNTENAQKARRPLDRIMKTIDSPARVEIKTTYEHLARRIGETVNSACKGNLNIQYVEGKKYVRVRWIRD